MAIDKPSLNDFLPNGFETQDKDGYKVNFDADKISAGYDKDTLEILSGPNLNNLLDNVGKNTHTLQQFLNFFRDMPIGSFPVVNTSNQLDYKSVNSFFRNVGEIVFSAIPLEDGNLRLLDGSLLEYTMTYSRFITYIAGYRTSLPNLFCTEQEFNQSVATYGVCGKFVYDTVTKSLRLPKISGFIKGTLDSGSLGDVDEAKAPNITGYVNGCSEEGQGIGGAFYANGYAAGGEGRARDVNAYFDASRSSSVYKNGVNTIEPQAVKEFIYMVVSIDEAEKQVLSAVYNYKGSVPTYADLPTAVAIGEVYNVIGEDPEGYSGANFAWTGEEWDRLGGTVNLSGYLTKVEGANTYATKSSLESNVDYLQGQINTNASNIANIASQEVIDAGIQKIEMLKFASTLGAGKVADTDMYSVIKKYKYSSFDRSKFTVVGSPVVTDDGIASNGDYQNSITANTTLDLTNKTCVVKGCFTINSLQPPTFAQVLSGSANIYYQYVSGQNRSILQLNVSSVWSNTITITSSMINIPIYYTLTINNDFANCSFIQNGVNIGTLLCENITSLTTGVTFGFYKQGGAGGKGYTTIDLKQFSITVDGVEVFSGNKTGIDTIKPSDYQVVGAPTISADGIITNWSNANTIKYLNAVNLGNSTNYEIHTRILTPLGVFDKNETNTLSEFIRISNSGNTNWSFNIYTQNHNNVSINGAGISYLGIGNINTSIAFLDFVIKNDGTNFTVTAYKPNGTILGASKTSPTAGNNLPLETVTVTTNNSSYFSTATPVYQIDMNYTKIYIDGNLVYQPCLKIPFHLSKTGLKVTDKLDRAIDMAEQCGFSDYFGLDEDNLLCLVPQGDNITGRRELISRVEDSVTHYVTEIYSDLYCRQMGSGTANTAVTLNIPYKDANYKLSVPQSAKSKTGFTPTASCDWTAEGYIYLDEVI